MRSLALALALTLGACASTDHAATMRNMDEATFQREMRARFNPAPPPLPARLADPRAGRRADAEYFAAFLQLDRSYSPRARTEAQRLATRLIADADTLSDEQFRLRVAEIAALADNGHTLLITLSMNQPLIPVRFYRFADGLRILSANEASADLLGARIDRIEGRRISELDRVLRRYQGGGTEAHRRFMTTTMLGAPALLEAAGIAEDRNSLLVSGVLLDGSPFERRLTAEASVGPLPFAEVRSLFPRAPAGMVGLLADNAQTPLSLQQAERTFWSAPVDDGFYIRITENADPRIPPFLEETLAQLRQTPPAFIVLDMRMNPGGDYTRTYAFARALPEAAGDARIYVLTSPWTFSAAITTISALKEAGGDQVTIVGESVGDRLDFWAEGGIFILPNAGAALLYATGRHVYNGPCDDLETCFWLNYLYPVRVRTLRPDIAAPWTFAAYREARDPAMEAVLARER